MAKVTKDFICASIGKSLREFGYPDASDDKMAEIYDAFKAGKRAVALPYGVLGRMAESQLFDVQRIMKELP